ncbi:MAG TPA: T9SS type A sorting domain-containing protein [Chitinophagaceae bacterium]
MKSNCTYAALKSLTLLFLIILITEAAQSQAPIYRFRNPTLTTGNNTAGNLNAIYRFSNVKTTGGPNIDALVTIVAKVGSISLQNIDRTADGYDEAFQPEYRIGNAGTGYFEFLITFVQSGTSTPAPQPLVELSGLDIDGSTSGGQALKEFNTIDMGGGICTFNTLGSELTLSQIGTAFDGSNFTGFLYGSLVDTAAKEVMFSVSNVNVTSFRFRAGATSTINGSNTRYASLYFMRFNYPQGAVLSVSNLYSFSGTDANGKTKLKWTLTEGNTANRIVLEKSNTGNAFQPVAEFFANEGGNTARDFNYTDNKGTEGTVYYRLKIAGMDGKIQYSNTLRFAAKQPGENALAVYPSLVQATTTISYNSPVQENAMVFVTDMSGRVVKKQNVLLQQGTNSILVTGFDQFRKGNYIVAVNTAEQRIAKQIIVQ